MITWTNVVITSEYRDEQRKQVAEVLRLARVNRNEVRPIYGNGETGNRQLGFDATFDAAAQLRAAGLTA
jgi:hypothetical protein